MPQPPLHVTAEVDCALGALVELARLGPGRHRAREAVGQEGSYRFTQRMLRRLGAAGLVVARRGAHGGTWLARPASEITVADVIRATGQIDRNHRGAATSITRMWDEVDDLVQRHLERVTIAALAGSRCAEPPPP